MGFALFTPERPEEACRLLAEGAPGHTVAIAGGTDLLIDLDHGRRSPERVVSLRRLPWRYSRWDGGRLEIGATLPLRALESDVRIRSELPGLLSAVRAVGSAALRQRATLGGNLGRSAPASDLLPVLLALDAEVALVGVSGSRSLPLDEFVVGSRATVLGHGELVASVTIPTARPCAYVWQRVRPSHDVSQIGVAVAAPSSGSSWSVALGGVPPRVVRLRGVEARLKGSHPSDTEVRAAADSALEEVTVVTDKRATEAYRRRLVGVLVRRAIQRVLAGMSGEPPSHPRPGKRE